MAIELADVLFAGEMKQEALGVVISCLAKHPANKELRFKCARIASETGEGKIAIHLLHDLARDEPDSLAYWGYLGNAALDLDLYDVALSSYRRAEKLMKEDDSSQWIVANIGNLLSNKGLTTEAGEYFERSLRFEPRSEYAHERLSRAIKKRSEERKELDKKCAEGKKRLREGLNNLL